MKISNNWNMIERAGTNQVKLKQYERFTITITEPYHAFLSFATLQERTDFLKNHIAEDTRYTLGEIVVNPRSSR